MFLHRRGEHNRCQSCGKIADVRLTNGSLWCWPCHGSAHNLGYDEEKSKPLRKPRDVGRGSDAG